MGATKQAAQKRFVTKDSDWQTLLQEAFRAHSLRPVYRPREAFGPGRAARGPCTPARPQVLELALREALLLGHNYIGTEHLLLGVLDEEDGLGARTLAGLGVTRERAMEWLVPALKRLAEAKHQAG
jgi:ATP-dependent Clp protease ATP-binding subunit ClpA